MTSKPPARQRARNVAGAQPPGGVTTTLTQTKVSAHSGPLPAPETLAEYEQFLPGSAERIFAMAEAQLSHRLHIEESQLRADIEHREELVALQRSGQKAAFRSDLVGQVMGFTIAIACVFGSMYAGLVADKPSVAAILLGVPIIGIIQAVRGMMTKEKPQKKTS